MTAIFQFQGHLQSGARQAGMEDLHFQVTRKFSGEEVFAPPPYRWNTDIEQKMDMLTRQGIHRVVLIGYSWGAGFACMRFAKLAPDRGIKIPLAILCDPVYRPTWMPRLLPANPLNIYSLDRRSKIRVPEAIRRVVSVNQSRSVPCGHDLIPTHPDQVIEPPTPLNRYTHLSIDEAPEWFDLVKRELSNFFETKP